MPQEGVAGLKVEEPLFFDLGHTGLGFCYFIGGCKSVDHRGPFSLLLLAPCQCSASWLLPGGGFNPAQQLLMFRDQIHGAVHTGRSLNLYLVELKQRHKLSPGR